MGFISVGHKIDVKRRRKNILPSNSFTADLLAKPVLKVSRPDIVTGLLHASAAPKANKLTDLPPEILVSIFCFAGIGEENSLPLTCRSLSQLLSPSKNKWIIDSVIKANFVADLNEGVDMTFWESRFHDSASLLPEEYQGTNVMDRLFNTPIATARLGWAIDSRVFDLIFVDEKIVRSIHRNFGGILMDSSSICHQQQHRANYMEWRLAILEKFVSLANEPDRMGSVSDESAEELLESAEESVTEFRTEKGLSKFAPQIKSSAQHFGSIKNSSLGNVRKLLTIHELYQTDVLGASALLSAVFKDNQVVSPEIYTALTNLLDMSSLDSGDVINLLETFESCRRRLSSIPENDRTSHSLHQITDRLFDLVREVLSSQYRMDEPGHAQQIWQVLKELQIPELLDHVIKVGGVMSLDLI